MDCTDQTELAYGEFSRWMRKKAAEKRVPLSGSLELTFRCNLRCVHCYLDGQHDSSPELRELSTTEIYDIIDQIVAEGCLWLLLTGGEPLVRPDWRDIYLYAKRKGLILTLFTNGTMLTPEDADFLAEWRPFTVEISLYGATEKTYEQVTGIPGSYRNCMRGIDLLLERGVPLKLKSMALQQQVAELPAMKAFAEKLGVGFRFDSIIRPEIQGSIDPYQYRLSPEEVVALEQSDPRKSARWEENYSGRFGHLADNGDLFICGAGKTSFHIDPFGKLSMCMTAREPAYSMRKGSFREGWTTVLDQARSVEHSESYLCQDCALRFLCNQCPAMAQLEYNDPEHPVDYLCEVAHRRAVAFMPGISEKQIGLSGAVHAFTAHASTIEEEPND